MPRFTTQVVSAMEREDLWVEIWYGTDDADEEHFADVVATPRDGEFAVMIHPRLTAYDWEVDLGDLRAVLERAYERSVQLRQPAPDPE